MRKVLFALMASTLLLTGCTRHEIGLPKDIEAKLEEELKVNVVIPEVEHYPVKYVGVNDPPHQQHQPAGASGRIVATIVYTDKLGPLIELPEEQRSEMEKRVGRKIYYGEYEGKPYIILEISNMKNFLADSKVQQIEGTQVEYSYREVQSGRYAFFSFNLENASYMTTFWLADSFQEKDALAFNRRLIAELKRRP